MRLRHGLHLAYCTNVHRGETWAETFQSLNDHTLAVKATVSPKSPYAIGLRLSDAAARELSDPQTLTGFRGWLEKNDCYVFTVNGFPFGHFHGGRVKEQVYWPDWTTPERLEYTNRLFDLLAALLPEGIEGSVSTLPGSFKTFIFGEGRARHFVRVANIPNGAQETDAPYPDSAKEKQMRDNLWRCVEHIAALSERTGKLLHLGLEPEPLGYLENSDETLKFFAELAAEHPNDPRLLRHLGVNYDTCHFAIEYEEPEVALKRFAAAGIRISKIHVSNALKLQRTAAAREQLAAFQDQVYLHQVIARQADGSLVRHLDLDAALSQPSTERGSEKCSCRGKEADEPLDSSGFSASLRRRLHADPEEWRVHFHIPLHAAPMGELQNTSDHILGVFRVLAVNPALCSHLEMETYTWEVMPAAFRNRRVEEQLVSEYEWTLARLGEHGLADPERVGRAVLCPPPSPPDGAHGVTRPTNLQ